MSSDTKQAADPALPPLSGSPVRVQRKRTKGWRMPKNTVSVCRPGKWGNPFKVGEWGTAAECVEKYEKCLFKWIDGKPHLLTEDDAISLDELRGKNLACFCRLDQPCHADVLLRLANE